MAIKPDSTVKTVVRRWTLSPEDVEKIICEHLGIPADNNTIVEIEEYNGGAEVTRTDFETPEEEAEQHQAEPTPSIPYDCWQSLI